MRGVVIENYRTLCEGTYVSRPFCARAIVAEIEAEQALVGANRKLVTRFEKKIPQIIARVWGEES